MNTICDVYSLAACLSETINEKPNALEIWKEIRHLEFLVEKNFISANEAMRKIMNLV